MGRRIDHMFFQRRHRNRQQIHEKVSSLLIIKEIQIKTPMRYHLVPVRIAIIKNKKTQQQEMTNAGEEVERRDHCARLVGMQIFAASMENSMQVHQKIKNRATVRSSNPTSGYISKENKNRILRYLHSYVHYSIIHNSLECSLTKH